MNLCGSCIASAMTAGSFVALWSSGQIVQWIAERKRQRAMLRIATESGSDASPGTPGDAPIRLPPDRRRPRRPARAHSASQLPAARARRA